MKERENLCECIRIHGMPLCTGGGCRNAEPITKPDPKPLLGPVAQAQMDWLFGVQPD